MRLIKIYGILTILVCISYFSVSTLSHFPEGILNRVSGGNSSTTIPQKGTILPIDEWEQVLIGKWNISFQIRNTSTVIVAKGESNFKPDSSFVDVIGYRFHDHLIPVEGSIDEFDLIEVGTAVNHGKIEWVDAQSDGRISKMFSFDKETGNPMCRVANTYKDEYSEFDFCGIMSEMLIVIGSHDWYESKYELLEFTENNISILVKTLSTEKPVLVKYEKVVQ